jgi:hypothetical protein
MLRTAYRSAFRNQRADVQDTQPAEVSSPVGAGSSTSVNDEGAGGPDAKQQALALRSPGHIDPNTIMMPYMDWHELPVDARMAMLLGMK